MDSLRSLATYIPGWIDRLDELSGQIEQHQAELARLEAASSPASGTSPRLSRTKSIRDKGSMESLRPTDEPAEESPQQAVTPLAAAVRRTRSKKRRTESLASLDGGDIDLSTLKKSNRTRRLIIVYYDSHVQTFFEDLVKFVSAQRNMMRKAKMAAKVAQIKRMAEMEMPDDEPEADRAGGNGLDAGGGASDAIAVDTAMEVDDKTAAADILAAKTARPSSAAMLANANGNGGRPLFMRASGRQGPWPTSTMAAATASSASAGFAASYLQRIKPQPDIYDDLDKNLEVVQSTSEHAAHQFLRVGDCNDEIAKIKQRLAQTREQAASEMERLRADNPEALKEVLKEEPIRSRSFRPQIMRRVEPKTGPTEKKAAKDATVPIAAATPAMDEVEDEGIEIDPAFQAVKV